MNVCADGRAVIKCANCGKRWYYTPARGQQPSYCSERCYRERKNMAAVERNHKEMISNLAPDALVAYLYRFAQWAENQLVECYPDRKISRRYSDAELLEEVARRRAWRREHPGRSAADRREED